MEQENSEKEEIDTYYIVDLHFILCFLIFTFFAKIK